MTMFSRKIGSAAAFLGGKCLAGASYLFRRRKEIWYGTKVGGQAFVSAVGGAAAFVYDTASLKMFNTEKIEEMRRRIEEQGRRYRGVVTERLRNHRMVDSVAVGGETLADIIAKGDPPADVAAAYAAAYPGLALHKTFAEAAASYENRELLGFVSGVKGKLFEMKYVDYLNSGNLPDGYHASLATSPIQPGWDIAVTGPDGHVARILQMKATDSMDYVRQALERYPDVDVVTTDEVHSALVMNGAADSVAASGIADADLTSHVEDAVQNANYHMDWTPPIISLALIAFTSYSMKDVDAYEKARTFGDRAAKSYLACLLASGVLAVTQTWWLALVAGVGSRYAAHTGRKRREIYQELERISHVNGKLIERWERG